MAWRKARPADDFAAMLPVLRRVLDLTREVAAAKAAQLGKSPYEALLDQYEPGGSAAEIDPLFDRPRRDSARLDRGRARAPGERAGAAAARRGRSRSRRSAAAGVALMAKLGFDFDHGRLDVSLHPFCGGTPDDVRITTRYDEADFAPRADGRAARDRPRALRARPARRLAPPAGRRRRAA